MAQYEFFYYYSETKREDITLCSTRRHGGIGECGAPDGVEVAGERSIFTRVGTLDRLKETWYLEAWLSKV